MKSRVSPGPIVQLIYTSTASDTLSADELTRIWASSERQNRQRGLTGLLMHRGNRFLGVLEGPELTLLRRMEVIITDPRHHGMRILREKTVTERRFDNWSFASLPATDASAVSLHAEEMFLQMLTDRLP